MHIATLYSGIGGADLGFEQAGHQIVWQCERDPWRRALLHAHWPTIQQYEDVATLTVVSTWPDLVYAELPDRHVDRWWPPILHVANQLAPTWLVVEFSPCVSPSDILVSASLAGWRVRYFYIEYAVNMGPIPERRAIDRCRAMLVGSRTCDVAMLGVDTALMRVVTDRPAIAWAEESLEWHEASRGLPVRWTCGCGQPDACTCDAQVRRAAISDATSPILTHWVASYCWPMEPSGTVVPGSAMAGGAAV